jgi:hypothetical protein
MSLTPIAWGYAFPCAKSSTKRIRIFKAQKICGLIQLKHRVGKVIPSHLVASLIQNALKAGT